MIKLQVIHNETGESQEENLTPEKLAQGGGLIGRHPGCDIVLDSPEVSRVHARIIYREGRYYFTDLGSTGGSRVNTQEASTNENFLLKSNDTIRIGGFILLIKEVEVNTNGKVHQPQNTPALETKPVPSGRFIFKEEELKAQGILNQKGSELIFEGKRLVQGLSLSNRFHQKAIDLCQAEVNAGKFCLLVEYSEHVTLWQEEQVEKQGNRTRNVLISDTQIHL